MNTTTVIKLALGSEVSLAAPEGVHTPKHLRMHRAFAIVDPKAWGRADWKCQISAVLTDADLEQARVRISDVAEAIAFFTATAARISQSTTTKGERVYVVRADGYRRGPAH